MPTRLTLPSGASSSSTPGARVPDVAGGVAAVGGTSAERAPSTRAGVIRSTADQIRAFSSSILGSRQHKAEDSTEGRAALPHSADASMIEESGHSAVTDRPAGATDVPGGIAIDRYGTAEHAAATRGCQPMSDARAGYKRDGACAGIGDASTEPEHAMAPAEFSELVRDTFLRVASMRDTTAADHVVIDLMLSKGEPADMIVQQLVACSAQQVTAAMADTTVVRRYVDGALRTPLPYSPLTADTTSAGARGKGYGSSLPRTGAALSHDHDDDSAAVRGRVLAQSLKEPPTLDEAELRWQQDLRAYLLELPSPAHDAAIVIANVARACRPIDHAAHIDAVVLVRRLFLQAPHLDWDRIADRARATVRHAHTINEQTLEEAVMLAYHEAHDALKRECGDAYESTHLADSSSAARRCSFTGTTTPASSGPLEGIARAGASHESRGHREEHGVDMSDACPSTRSSAHRAATGGAIPPGADTASHSAPPTGDDRRDPTVDAGVSSASCGGPRAAGASADTSGRPFDPPRSSGHRPAFERDETEHARHREVPGGGGTPSARGPTADAGVPGASCGGPRASGASTDAPRRSSEPPRSDGHHSAFEYVETEHARHREEFLRRIRHDDATAEAFSGSSGGIARGHGLGGLHAFDTPRVHGTEAAYVEAITEARVRAETEARLRAEEDRYREARRVAEAEADRRVRAAEAERDRLISAAAARDSSREALSEMMDVIAKRRDDKSFEVVAKPYWYGQDPPAGRSIPSSVTPDPWEKVTDRRPTSDGALRRGGGLGDPDELCSLMPPAGATSGTAAEQWEAQRAAMQFKLGVHYVWSCAGASPAEGAASTAKMLLKTVRLHRGIAAEHESALRNVAALADGHRQCHELLELLDRYFLKCASGLARIDPLLVETWRVGETCLSLASRLRDRAVQLRRSHPDEEAYTAWLRCVSKAQQEVDGEVEEGAAPARRLDPAIVRYAYNHVVNETERYGSYAALLVKLDRDSELSRVALSVLERGSRDRGRHEGTAHKADREPDERDATMTKLLKEQEEFRKIQQATMEQLAKMSTDDGRRSEAPHAPPTAEVDQATGSPQLPMPRDKTPLMHAHIVTAIRSGRFHRRNPDGTVASDRKTPPADVAIPPAVNPRLRNGRCGVDCTGCLWYAVTPPKPQGKEYSWQSYESTHNSPPFGPKCTRPINLGDEVILHYICECKALQFCMECHVRDNPADATWNTRMSLEEHRALVRRT